MSQRDEYGNFIDHNGSIFGTNDGRQPTGGQQVTTYDQYGNRGSGIWSGGSVIHDQPQKNGGN